MIHFQKVGVDMGVLLSVWNAAPRKFDMSLKQVVTNAGDGELSDDISVSELREFFSLIDLDTMKRLLCECYSTEKKYKFETRGFAFQDLVNEMGRRLGYTVEHGLYRGKTNAIGFDGYWKTDDGYNIIVESKTNDDYSISIDSVIGYRDQLLEKRHLSKKKTSILIIYGRDNRSGLLNAVKGSNESYNMRVISATALFELVKLRTEALSPIVQNQINKLLRPMDCFLLDNLVQLAFPKTDDAIPDVESEPVPPSIADNGQVDKAVTSIDSKKEGAPATGENGMPTNKEKPLEEQIFYLKGRKYSGTARFIPDGQFDVFADSRMSPDTTNTCPQSIIDKRNMLIESGIVKDYVFVQNHAFSSPSLAAACLYGGNVNGPEKWKNDKGQSINDLKH